MHFWSKRLGWTDLGQIKFWKQFWWLGINTWCDGLTGRSTWDPYHLFVDYFDIQLALWARWTSKIHKLVDGSQLLSLLKPSNNLLSPSVRPRSKSVNTGQLPSVPCLWWRDGRKPQDSSLICLVFVQGSKFKLWCCLHIEDVILCERPQWMREFETFERDICLKLQIQVESNSLLLLLFDCPSDLDLELFAWSWIFLPPSLRCLIASPVSPWMSIEDKKLELTIYVQNHLNGRPVCLCLRCVFLWKKKDRNYLELRISESHCDVKVEGYLTDIFGNKPERM